MRFEEVLPALRDEGKPVRRDSWSACLTLRLQGAALEWDWGPVFGRSRTGWEISAGDLTADDWRVVDPAAPVRA